MSKWFGIARSSNIRKLKWFLFEDLDPAIQRKFLNTNVRVVFLEEGTTENVRQEIFKRINTSGSPIKPAEARRGSWRKIQSIFRGMCKNPLFNELAPRTKITEDRYEGFELVSRFLHIMITMMLILKIIREMLLNILMIM